MRFFFFLPAGSEGEAWELRWPSRFSPQGGKEHALLEAAGSMYAGSCNAQISIKSFL